MTDKTKQPIAQTEPADIFRLIATTPNHERIMATQNEDLRIEFWWDGQTKLWICYLINEDGHQVGAAEYAPNKPNLPWTINYLERAAMSEDPESY